MRILLVLLLFLSLSANAAIRITASLSITNGTTNGQTIVINGSTRTWTNSVFVPLTQVLTNSTAAGAKTNLYSHFGSSPIASVAISDAGSTNFNFIGQCGSFLTVTPSAGWATVSYSTQQCTTLVGVRVPVSGEPASAQQTNIASGLVHAFNMNVVTQALFESSTSVSNLVGRTNAQSISGNKTFTGTNIYSNSFSIFYNGTVSNATDISGNLGTVTNGSWRNPKMIGDTSITNGVLAITNGTQAYVELSPNQGSVVWRLIGLTTGLTIGQIGTGNWLSLLTNGSTIVSAVASSQPAFIVQAAGTTATNLVEIQGPGQNIVFSVNTNGNAYLSGSLYVVGSITNVTTRGTNNFPAGSDIAFGRYANASLASGNNSGVIVGTNVYMEVSGPGAAFSIHGITGSPNRDGKLIIIDNNTGFDMTIAHQSGTDPVAGNRIISNTGADRTTTGNGSAILIYNGTTSRWKLVHFDP